MSFASRLKELREGAGLERDEAAMRIAKKKYPRPDAEDVRAMTQKLYLAEMEGIYPDIDEILVWADALDLPDDTTEELVARRMAERYDAGDAWEMWLMPAARVIEEVTE